MRRFFLGVASVMFFGFLGIGFSVVISRVNKHGNSQYATVDECVLDRMKGQSHLLIPTAVSYCKSIVKEPPKLDFSSSSVLVVPQPKKTE